MATITEVLATWPALPDGAQACLVTPGYWPSDLTLLPPEVPGRWPLFLAQNPQLSTHAWYAMWESASEWIATRRNSLSSARHILEFLAGGNLTREQRHRALVEPAEQWSDSGRSSVLESFLRTHQMDSSERSLLSGRKFTSDVTSYLLDDYSDDAAFQLQMFPPYSAIQKLRVLSTVAHLLPEEEVADVLVMGTREVLFGGNGGGIDRTAGPLLRQHLDYLLHTQETPSLLRALTEHELAPAEISEAIARMGGSVEAPVIRTHLWPTHPGRAVRAAECSAEVTFIGETLGSDVGAWCTLFDFVARRGSDIALEECTTTIKLLHTTK
jgi:hypothetical protein